MRKDESGNSCPETLGEYRDLCAAIGPKSKAVAFLDKKIAESSKGREEVVIAADSQMRLLLMPMLMVDEEPDISVEMSGASKDGMTPEFKEAMSHLLELSRERFPTVSREAMTTIISEEMAIAINNNTSAESVRDRITKRLAAQVS